MSVGAWMVGGAVALVLIAYVSRPFWAEAREKALEPRVEAWVAELRAASVVSPPETSKAAATESEVMRFCPYCGRPVRPDHRFCPGCGRALREERS